MSWSVHHDEHQQTQENTCEHRSSMDGQHDEHQRTTTNSNEHRSRTESPVHIDWDTLRLVWNALIIFPRFS
ncbi:hypothetical protein M404DRAFT_36647 [Pisolithus tinctorius Marx 270]|uniref:Uncharacterized protein n=1 Tax=Pisolithus tinctorius Marx 270 TaxID=870435 RepID=A0A0C3NAE0_PISTI|nr:hypothetical protein M404DRAFT_36647 [Pisolithus tinctorius Marx 270]